jgi:tRNA G18 (ribose-2'-O)-methylase SpoU
MPEQSARTSIITSLDDPRVEDYRSVRDRDALGADGRPGLFVGETRLVVDRMLERPGCTRSVFVEARHASAMREAMDAAGRADVPLYAADETVLQAIAGFNVHRGVLAIGYRPDPSAMRLDAVLPSGSCTLLVCEGIANIDNIGSLYRNAAAFGVDAVVLDHRCHDPLYRKSLRVSMGHALSLPTVRAGADEAGWLDALDRLRTEHRVRIIGCGLRGPVCGRDAEPLDAIEPPERVAVLVGSEYDGLSENALRRCDAIARIPMAPGIDSLNVAVAAAVCLHRFSRCVRR